MCSSSSDISTNGSSSTTEPSLAPEKKSRNCLPNKWQVLKTTLVALGIIALLVGAGLALHYTVGFHWLNTTHITWGEGLLYIGLPALGAPILLLVAVKIAHCIRRQINIANAAPIILGDDESFARTNDFRRSLT